MPTISQAFLLGSERLTAAPAVPHPALGDAWTQLDWAGAKDAALLEAAALLGAARLAAAPLGPTLPELAPAPAELQPTAPVGATRLLPRLLTDEWKQLLPEWLECCAACGCVAPPFFLPRLLDLVTSAADRAQLLRVLGERGRWLARQNPAWAWVGAAEPLPDPTLWETGSPEERLGCLRALRASEPANALALIEKTWADDAPEFRLKTIERLRVGLSPADEPLLTRALGDRRKDVRSAAQALLALLPESALGSRLRGRAENILSLSRGLLGRKLEVTLPGAFDPGWKADGIEEKPPTGTGEKAFWVQQILGLVPLRHWAQKFALTSSALIEMAAKSGEWAELLLGAWFRAAVLHADADACEALIKPVIDAPKFLPAGTPQNAALAALLAACNDAQRWRLVAEHEAIAWTAIGVLRGTPTREQSRALLRHLAPALRDGFNPAGSPGAVLAARQVLPELRDEAARLLTRDDGVSRPAEAFLQALELRATLHAAFADHSPQIRS